MWNMFIWSTLPFWLALAAACAGDRWPKLTDWLDAWFPETEEQ